MKNKFVRILERMEKEQDNRTFSTFDEWWKEKGCQDFNRNLIEIIGDPIGNIPLENLMNVPAGIDYNEQDIVKAFTESGCSCDLVRYGDDVCIVVNGY